MAQERSTYFAMDPARIPLLPVEDDQKKAKDKKRKSIHEKVHGKKQITYLKDGSCLAESTLDEKERNELRKIGATIIGDVDKAHKWIKENHENMPEDGDI